MSSLSPPPQSVDQFKGKARLPKFAAPLRYDLFLKPNIAEFSFTGSASIAVDVLASTRFLVFNAADLLVEPSSIRFSSSSRNSQEVKLLPNELVAVEDDEILVLGFDADLPIGKGVLSMDFTGTLNDQMRGFYRSMYQYNGETKYMAVTQFEAVDARRCFPCWDEPAFKAIFKLTLEVPSELVALSNMPVLKEEVSGHIRTLYFEETPLMSTYLVAIVVGLFDYIEDQASDGSKVRVYTQVGKVSQGKFALEVAVKSLELYKDYFAVPYPLPKLDMVAIPDFAAGAMENYGLVTYRETALLYDVLLSAAANKQNVAITVAHELAHQWFGNLVTMEWWTHLWLNEGFATWVSYLAVDSLFPEWKIWTQFLDDTASGLQLDSLSESHPIEVGIKHATEVDSIFDSISYDKGASVIRMLQSYLGAEVFQKALAAYIKKYAYSNAKTEDLWAVLEDESGQPVKDLMSSWTKQQGFPAIHATYKPKEHVLEIQQEQFLLDGSTGLGMWIVPLTLCYGSYSTKRNFLLRNKVDNIDMHDLFSRDSKPGSDGFWIKINIDQTGFYRVKYDDTLAAGLVYALQTQKLSLMDKIGVVEDSYALCKACKLMLSSMLFLLNAYNEESDYTVLSHVISAIRSISHIVSDATPKLSDSIKELFIGLLQINAKKLGWDRKEGESHLDIMLRSELLYALVDLGHAETIKEGVRRFNIFVHDQSTSLLPPDIRKVAYVAVMQTVTSSDRTGYDSLLKIYRAASQTEEKVRILGSLATCLDKDIVLEALNFILTDEVRRQDAYVVLRSISWAGRETGWSWLKDKWDYISKSWSSSSLISDFIISVVSPFTSLEKVEEVNEFFVTRKKPGFARSLKQSIERVRINARWVASIQKDEASLAKAIEELRRK